MLSGHMIPELKKIGVIEKQLSDHKIGAGVDLSLEMPPIHMLALLAGDMTLRESGHADRKIALLPYESHELVGKSEAAGSGLEFATSWGGPTQGEQLADTH